MVWIMKSAISSGILWCGMWCGWYCSREDKGPCRRDRRKWAWLEWGWTSACLSVRTNNFFFNPIKKFCSNEIMIALSSYLWHSIFYEHCSEVRYNWSHKRICHLFFLHIFLEFAIGFFLSVMFVLHLVNQIIYM